MRPGANKVVHAMPRPENSHPLRNGLGLLTYLGRAPRALGVTELARASGLAKSSVHDLLQILVEQGYVEYRGARGGYAISPRVMAWFHDLGGHFMREGKLNDVLAAASERLECSIYVMRLAGRQVVMVGGFFFKTPSGALGSTPPVHLSSAGKILVAQLPRERRDEFMPEDAKAAEEFRLELERAEATGVGWNLRGIWEGECSLAAAVPSFQPPSRIAVALVMPSKTFDARDRVRLAAEVKALARDIHDTCPGL